MKEIKVKFKKVFENELVIKGKDKNDILNKALDVFINSNFKDIKTNNTIEYYEINVDKKSYYFVKSRR